MDSSGRVDATAAEQAGIVGNIALPPEIGQQPADGIQMARPLEAAPNADRFEEMTVRI
jgi:hypothetical protein